MPAELHTLKLASLRHNDLCIDDFKCFDMQARNPGLTTDRLITLKLPNPEATYVAASTAENLTKLLTARWIESIRLPEGEPAHIDLISKRGGVTRIFPEFCNGCFIRLNVIPIP